MADVLDQLDPKKDALGTIARRHFRAEAANLPGLSSNPDLFPKNTRTYSLPEPPAPRNKKGR